MDKVSSQNIIDYLANNPTPSATNGIMKKQETDICSPGS